MFPVATVQLLPNDMRVEVTPIPGMYRNMYLEMIKY